MAGSTPKSSIWIVFSTTMQLLGYLQETPIQKIMKESNKVSNKVSNTACKNYVTVG